MYWYLISKPECHISTQQVFTSPDLVRNTPKISLDSLDLRDVMKTYHNDCESLVIKHYPEVANLLAWLIEYAPSQMTGTGACIFSRLDSEKEARHLQATLPKGINSFVAKGLNQSNIFNALAIAELD
jgi:4-diphosphocytidyl-2-C-methyl-D-erythritol kinase